MGESYVYCAHAVALVPPGDRGPRHWALRRVISERRPALFSDWRQSRESRTLAALRDALLPKLISGELRVKNIEEMIGRIV
jgi:hypothetical protein